MSDMKITPNFALSEFTNSEVAARLGLTVDPPPDVIENLVRLCQTVLQPARTALGKDIIITSGYRPEWLNAAVRGAINSAHIRGLASDCRTKSMSPLTFARYLRHLELPIDKCIVEFNQWVHIQIAALGKEPRGLYMRANSINGKTIYEEGI